MTTGPASLLERFCVKFYAADPGPLDLGDAIAVFHRWIQSSRLAGLLIDVVDYRHVPDGPAVALVGHEADYFLDLAEGPLGLLYNRKRLAQGSNAERLRAALAATLDACCALEAEPEFRRAGLKFDGGALRLILGDRLSTPNADETLVAIRPDLDAALAPLYPGSVPRIVRDVSDPRQRFTLHVETGRTVGAAELLARLRPA